MSKGDRILTTGEAAELCGVSRSTLRRAVANGQLPAWRTPGLHLRFSEAACLAFAQALGRDDLELVGRREPFGRSQPVSLEALGRPELGLTSRTGER